MKFLDDALLRVPGLALASLLAFEPSLGAQSPGVVFTQTNAPAGNAVIELHRAPSGRLTLTGTHATGGAGTGTALGSQGSVALGESGKLLFVVNAGDDTLTVLRRAEQGWTVADVEPTRGDLPVSVTQHGGRVFVLNGGAPANVAGFELSASGELDPIPGALEALSSPDSLPAQVRIAPDGARVFVTEKATDKIAIFPLSAGGELGPGAFVDSAGPTPLGFAFGLEGTLIVAEANGGAPQASAATSYRVGASSLEVVTRSARAPGGSAGWISVTRDGRFAYATSSLAGSVAAFAVAGGALVPLGAGEPAGSLGPGAKPIDQALSADGRWLHVLSPATGEIATFRVRSDGTLDELPSHPGIPASAVGLAAR